MKTKQDLLELIASMDVHPTITDIVVNSENCEDDELEDALSDLQYLKDEISRVLRLAESELTK